MPTAPTLRRARPLDVVNLYRLVSEQGEFDPFDRSDEAGALRHVLDAIQNGYVLVAENKAGRLVAALAFVGYRLQSGDLVCFGDFFVVIQPYRESSVTADLLDLAIRAARQTGLPVHVPRTLPPDSPLAAAARQTGFKTGSHSLIWTNDASDKRRISRRSVQPRPS